MWGGEGGDGGRTPENDFLWIRSLPMALLQQEQRACSRLPAAPRMGQGATAHVMLASGWASPGQGGLQFLLLLGQLHLELGDLRLELCDLVAEVRGVSLQLAAGLLQFLALLLLPTEALCQGGQGETQRPQWPHSCLLLTECIKPNTVHL